jgi:hypothetical protein
MLLHFPLLLQPPSQYFASLGLVDINLQAKPALTVWDDLFKNRKLVSGN